MNRVNRRRHRLLIAFIALALAAALMVIDRAPRVDVSVDVLPAFLP